VSIHFSNPVISLFYNECKTQCNGMYFRSTRTVDVILYFSSVQCCKQNISDLHFHPTLSQISFVVRKTIPYILGSKSGKCCSIAALFKEYLPRKKFLSLWFSEEDCQLVRPAQSVKLIGNSMHSRSLPF